MNSALDDTASFAPRCLSLDLEVGVRDRRIHAFAALRPDTGARVVFRGGDLTAALAELDALAHGAAFLLGHNLIAFDLPQLEAAKPDLRLLRVPAVDTLRLNPLAFPRNPYHHLVKHGCRSHTDNGNQQLTGNRTRLYDTMSVKWHR